MNIITLLHLKSDQIKIPFSLFSKEHSRLFTCEIYLLFFCMFVVDVDIKLLQNKCKLNFSCIICLEVEPKLQPEL